MVWIRFEGMDAIPGGGAPDPCAIRSDGALASTQPDPPGNRRRGPSITRTSCGTSCFTSSGTHSALAPSGASWDYMSRHEVCSPLPASRPGPLISRRRAAPRPCNGCPSARLGRRQRLCPLGQVDGEGQRCAMWAAISYDEGLHSPSVPRRGLLQTHQGTVLQLSSRKAAVADSTNRVGGSGPM